MTAPADEPMDGGAMDPAIARVLLMLFEAVACASEEASRALRRLGVDERDILPLMEWTVAGRRKPRLRERV